MTRKVAGEGDCIDARAATVCQTLDRAVHAQREWVRRACVVPLVEKYVGSCS